MPLEQIARLLSHTGSTVAERVYRPQLRPVLEGAAPTMDTLFPERPQPWSFTWSLGGDANGVKIAVAGGTRW